MYESVFVIVRIKKRRLYYFFLVLVKMKGRDGLCVVMKGMFLGLFVWVVV